MRALWPANDGHKDGQTNGSGEDVDKRDASQHGDGVWFTFEIL